MIDATSPFSAFISTVNALNKMRKGSQAEQQSADLTKVYPGLLQNKLLGGQLKNKTSQVNLNTLGARNQATLNSLNLGNAIKNIMMPYEGQLAQAKIDASNATNQYLPIKMQLGEQQLKLAPQKLALTKEQIKNSSKRLGPQYQENQTLKVLPTAQRSVYIAQNPNAIYSNQTSALNEANSANANGQPYPVATINPTKVSQFQNASEQEANNALTTTSTRRQVEGGQQLKALISDPSFMAGAQSYANYAGALGKGKEFFDKWTNSNQDQLTTAMSFKNNMIPILASRIKTVDGMGATDQQRDELHNLFLAAFNSPSSNPQRAMQSINKLTDYLGRVEDAVTTSGQKVFKVTPIGEQPTSGVKQQSSNKSNFSDKEIKEYAQQNGLSVAQVKQMIAARK